MDRDAFIKILDPGHILGVTFLKKDGTVREMICRLGVKSHLAGGEANFDGAEKGIVTVFDMKAEGYRAIIVDQIISVRARGREVFKCVNADQIIKSATSIIEGEKRA